MKTLVLIRHAKSSWKNDKLKDMERPLKKRGLKDAPMMGKVLREFHVTPDLVISSPALRAMETAKLILAEYQFDSNPIVEEPKLYLESKGKLLSEVNKIDDKFNSVFLISHNPGITDLANSLIGETIDNIPTSGVVGIQFDCDTWAQVEKGKGKKMFFEVPKNHRKKVEQSEKQEVL